MPNQHKAHQTGIATQSNPIQETVLCEVQRILSWMKSENGLNLLEYTLGNYTVVKIFINHDWILWKPFVNIVGGKPENLYPEQLNLCNK